MKSIPDDFNLVLLMTTESSFENAQKLANVVLERRLAACITFREIRSMYWWKGSIENGKEFQLLVKTNMKNLIHLVEVIKGIHSYDNPEIVYWNSLTVKDYGKWIDDSTQ